MHRSQQQMHLRYALTTGIIAPMQNDKSREVLTRLITATGKRPTDVAGSFCPCEKICIGALTGDALMHIFGHTNTAQPVQGLAGHPAPPGNVDAL
jgi:hypothetical protein